VLFPFSIETKVLVSEDLFGIYSVHMQFHIKYISLFKCKLLGIETELSPFDVLAPVHHSGDGNLPNNLGKLVLNFI
jgi:hypothetical protein